MNKITFGKLKAGVFGGERVDFYLDGAEIGYWFCDKVLRREHGSFHPNENLKNLLGKDAWAGGHFSEVKQTLQTRLNQTYGTCTRCNGKGEYLKDDERYHCVKCHGTGVARLERA